MSTATEDVDLVGEEVAANLARAALFAALTGVFAYVSFQLPVTSVPFTLQVLGVFLAGVFLGPVWGGASMVIYVVAGAVGAPVFAYGSAGLGSLFGQWGGYLWSYPIAAGLVGIGVHGRGELTDPGSVGLSRRFGAMGFATLVISACGPVGSAISGDVSLATGVRAAAFPFVPAEAIKTAATVAIVRSDAVVAR